MNIKDHKQINLDVYLSYCPEDYDYMEMFKEMFPNPCCIWHESNPEFEEYSSEQIEQLKACSVFAAFISQEYFYSPYVDELYYAQKTGKTICLIYTGSVSLNRLQEELIKDLPSFHQDPNDSQVFIDHLTKWFDELQGESSFISGSEDDQLEEIIVSENSDAGPESIHFIIPQDYQPYFTSQWCLSVVNEEWLRMDHKYHDLDIKYKPFAQYYIDKIEAAPKDTIEAQWYKQCFREYEDEYGETHTINKAESFLESLNAYIERELQDRGEVLAMKTQLAESRQSLSKCLYPEEGNMVMRDELRSTFLDYANKADQVVKKSIESAKLQVASVLQHIFAGEETTEFSDSSLIHYLYLTEKEIMHPCALRYFVYKLMDLLTSQYKQIEAQLDDNHDLVLPFDNRLTMKLEKAEEYTNQLFASENIITRLTKKIDEFSKYIGAQEAAAAIRASLIVKRDVYKLSLQRLQKISRSLDIMFDCLDQSMSGLKQKNHQWIDEYSQPDSSSYYLCTGNHYLDEKFNEVFPRAREGELYTPVLKDLLQHNVSDGQSVSQSYADQIIQALVKTSQNHAVTESNVLDALITHVLLEKNRYLPNEQLVEAVKEFLLNHIRKISLQEDEVIVCQYNPLGLDESRPFIKEILGFINEKMGGMVNTHLTPNEMLLTKRSIDFKVSE